jgi:hypothetical protein
MVACYPFLKKLLKFFSAQDSFRFWYLPRLLLWELIAQQNVLSSLQFKNGMERDLECWKELSMSRCQVEQEEEEKTHKVLLLLCLNHKLMWQSTKNYYRANQRMTL